MGAEPLPYSKVAVGNDQPPKSDRKKGRYKTSDKAETAFAISSRCRNDHELSPRKESQNAPGLVVMFAFFGDQVNKNMQLLFGWPDKFPKSTISDFSSGAEDLVGIA